MYRIHEALQFLRLSVAMARRFPELERFPPEEPTDLFLLVHPAQDRGRQRITPLVNLVKLLGESQPVLFNINQPTVMRKSSYSWLVPAAAFPAPRRYFDIACFSDADHFRAHPQRIANVFPGVRTDYQIDRFVFEGIGRLLANVSLYPGVSGKVFNRPPQRRVRVALCKSAIVIPSRFIRLGVP